MITLSNATAEAILRSKAMIELGSSTQVPVKVAYWVNRFIKEMDSLVKIYNQEKAKLFEIYAVKDEKGKPKVVNNEIQILPDKMEEFSAKAIELANIELKLPFEKIVIDLKTFPPNILSAISMPVS